jgi:hypothetical protein
MLKSLCFLLFNTGSLFERMHPVNNYNTNEKIKNNSNGSDVVKVLHLLNEDFSIQLVLLNWE